MLNEVLSLKLLDDVKLLDHVLKLLDDDVKLLVNAKMPDDEVSGASEDMLLWVVLLLAKVAVSVTVDVPVSRLEIVVSCVPKENEMEKIPMMEDIVGRTGASGGGGADGTGGGGGEGKLRGDWEIDLDELV